MKFFGIDEVEDLEHDKCVEDKGEMPGDDHGLFINSLIIPATINKFHSATSDSTAYNTVVPFEIWTGSEECRVESVN